MKTIKITFLSLVAACTMASCDFLEKEPYKITPENYFQNETEVSNFLTGIYANLSQTSFYGNDYMVLAGGDDLEFYGGSTGRISNTGLICNNTTTSDAAVTQFWADLYSGIERANMLLEHIDNVPSMSAEKTAQYKSEARFLRAFYYFNLVQCWGDVPLKLESTYSSGTVTDKDIARTDKNVIYKFIVKEMEEAADEGLLSAKDLGYKPNRISKSAAWGILARVYLFWAGEHNRDDQPEPAEAKSYFERASHFGQLVMGEGHELSTNYWDVFIDMCSNKYNTSGKNESIWEAEFAGDGTGDVRSEGRIGNTIGLQCSDFSSQSSLVGKADPGYSYGFLWSTPKLYNLYKSHGDMKRFTWNIAPFTYRALDSDADKDIKGKVGIVGRTFETEELYKVVTGSDWYESYDYEGADDGTQFVSKGSQRGDVYKKQTAGSERRDLCCAKFRREYEPAAKRNKNLTSINFPILRYSDVLLMVAEAENEYYGYPTQLAQDCLKEVRERAGVNVDRYIPSLTTQSKFREAIKDERAMELCFEYTRRFDLIRWGEFVERMNEQAEEAQVGNFWNQASQVVQFFRVTSAYRYFPIPDAERAVNKLITTNNPGW
jgi:hypothetical protein